MERLAPFAPPKLMLEDKKPRMRKRFAALTLDKEGANKGNALHTFGLTTGADKAGTSMQRLDPFGLNSDTGKEKPHD